MFRVWYQYKDLQPELIEETDTMEDAEELVDEYTLACFSNIDDICLWIEDKKEDE